MTKYIAVTAGIVVVLGALLLGSYGNVGQGLLVKDFSLFPLNFTLAPSRIPLEIPNLNATKEEKAAWDTFEKYLDSARAHDIEGLRTVSYKISSICNDASKQSECFGLMDNVYAIGSEFKQADFRHAAFDDRQLVMYTDYEPMRFILAFVREGESGLKLLGIKWCFAPEEGGVDDCINVDPATRDADKNGWWDSLEPLLNK
jgi:hypothetical protein